MWVNLTVTVARIAGRALCLAQATAVQGGLALTLLDLEERAGNDEAAVASRAQAQEALTSCASDGSAPAGLRAKAETGLAGLAGEDYPDRCASTKRPRSVGPRRPVTRPSWRGSGATGLTGTRRRQTGRRPTTSTKQTSTASRRRCGDVVAQPCRRARRRCEAGLQGDRGGVPRRAKADPSFYERALEFADMGKARAFLRSLATFATPGPTPVRLLRASSSSTRCGHSVLSWPSFRQTS